MRQSDRRYKYDGPSLSPSIFLNSISPGYFSGSHGRLTIFETNNSNIAAQEVHQGRQRTCARTRTAGTNGMPDGERVQNAHRRAKRAKAVKQKRRTENQSKPDIGEYNRATD